MNKDTAIKYIQANNHIGIKAGTERDSFLEIWMVVVDNRIFARSWGLAERSWHHTFLQNQEGEIKCGSEVFKIGAQIPTDEADLMKKINEAYLSKYSGTAHNKKYADGIIKQAHIEKTMEFNVL